MSRSFLDHPALARRFTPGHRELRERARSHFDPARLSEWVREPGGHLRKGVSRTEARDVLWSHNSVEMWDLLVRQRGWRDARFGRWIGQQLVAALL